MSLNHVPIFVINMEDNLPRLRDVTNQLKTFNLEFERIDAVAGRSLTQQQLNDCYDSELNKQFHHRDLTKGEIGCYLSHRKIWQKMNDENTDRALILEDDIAIKSEISEGLDISNDEQGWDVSKVAYAENVTPAETKKVNQNIELVSYYKVPNRTMGYFITQDAAKKMLNKDKIYRPVDVDFQFYRDFDISVCGFVPSCVEISPVFGLDEQSDIVRQNCGEHNNHSTFWRNLKYRFSLNKRRKTQSYQLDNFQI